jgi:hypothetical protein
MGRLCLPMAFVRPTAPPEDDATVIDPVLRARRPSEDDAPTVVSRRRSRSVSQLGVIVSAAAFAALASSAALWLTQ